MPQLNAYQWVLIIVAVLSAISGASAQLTDLLGGSVAHTVVTAATLANTIISGIMAALVGNASMVKSVAALPGVSRVVVNTQAAPAVAAVAVDASQPKVGPADISDRQRLQEIAKG